MNYIDKFEKNGFGLFVHLGLYSIIGKGEWINSTSKYPNDIYEKYINEFDLSKTWAKELVKYAKKAGCKYITLTTRHHDGFSLYDTKGLSTFDCMHSKGKRDYVREFVDECNKAEIVPFFYHTLLDWKNSDYKNNFPKYIDYLVKSIEILCTNYGKIGGFWFDGMWDKKNEDWQEDRLYSTIRKYQKDAMIINNTGLFELGKTGHKEIDSTTFERNVPNVKAVGEKHLATEMCEVLNDHWGIANMDINYKPMSYIINDLVDCRFFGANLLLNVGPMKNGKLRTIDKGYLEEIGKWIKENKNFIYDIKPCLNIKGTNTSIAFDGKYYYAYLKNVCMSSNANVALGGILENIKIDAKIKNAVWLDDLSKAEIKGDEIVAKAYPYGKSLTTRIIRFEI